MTGIKKSDFTFYAICFVLGCFNRFHGIQNIIYVCCTITIAIIVSSFVRKYDEGFEPIVNMSTVILIAMAILVSVIVAIT